MTHQTERVGDCLKCECILYRHQTYCKNCKTPNPQYVEPNKYHLCKSIITTTNTKKKKDKKK